MNLAGVAALLSALAGLAGTVLVPLVGTSLATSSANVLQAVSGLLLAIGAYHVTSVAAFRAMRE